MGKTRSSAKGAAKGRGRGRSTQRSSVGNDSANLNDSSHEELSQGSVSIVGPAPETSRSRGRSNRSVRINEENTVARFVEDGNVVDMTAEGMDTEYPNDDETEEETEGEDSQNNNATIRRVVHRKTAAKGGRNSRLEDRRSSERSSGVQGHNDSQGSRDPDDPPELAEGDSTADSDQDERPVTARPQRSESQNGRNAKKRHSEDHDEILSLREELDNVNQSFAKLQKLMEKGTYTTTPVAGPSHVRGNLISAVQEQGNVGDDTSETTVYKDAVQPKRDSSSSEELVNLSDETIDPVALIPGPVETMINQIRGVDLHSVHVVDSRERDRYEHSRDDEGRRSSSHREYDHRDDRRRYSGERDHRGDHRSGRNGGHSRNEREPPEREAQRRADELIKQAESQKARIYDVPGRSLGAKVDEQKFLHSLYVDANYTMVASHLDDITRRKIENCEYVDFCKLIPRDKIDLEQDNRMVQVFENGEQFWRPYVDKKAIAISSYQKWEVAFRVFSDVFTRKYPEKCHELIQYNHVIYSASNSNSWENVYAYDKEFRIHMAKYPLRSWSIILQQAWNMKLKDRGRQFEATHHSHDNDHRIDNRSDNRSKNKNGKMDACWRFNKGRCSYGTSCRFEHKCMFCNKFGHGSNRCRRGDDRGEKGEKKGDDKKR